MAEAGKRPEGIGLKPVEFTDKRDCKRPFSLACIVFLIFPRHSIRLSGCDIGRSTNQRIMPGWWNGRHAVLRGRWPKGRAGSSPAPGTRNHAAVAELVDAMDLGSIDLCRASSSLASRTS